MTPRLMHNWKRFLPVAIPLSVAVVVAMIVAVMWSLGSFSQPPDAAPETAPIAAEAPQPPAAPVPQGESVKPVAIQSLNQMKYSPVWNPADTGDGFWQVVDPEMGYPETGGTRYVLAHACESHACAGDDLLALTEGDTLDFLGTAYVIERKFSTKKTEIADQPIWDHVPGRVVLITCVIDGSWEDSDHNEVFVATPAT